MLFLYYQHKLMIQSDNMKKYFAILIFLSVSFVLCSQDFDGNYKDKTDSLTFSNGKVIFNVSGFGALLHEWLAKEDTNISMIICW